MKFWSEEYDQTHVFLYSSLRLQNRKDIPNSLFWCFFIIPCEAFDRDEKFQCFPFFWKTEIRKGFSNMTGDAMTTRIRICIFFFL